MSLEAMRKSCEVIDFCDRNAQGDPLTKQNSSQNIFLGSFSKLVNMTHRYDVIMSPKKYSESNQLLTFNANGTRQHFVFLSCIGDVTCALLVT